jgi:spore coat protein A, manganese oxidase
MKRRDFIKITAAAGAAAMLPWRRAYAAFLTSPSLTKFTHNLRRFGIDIPVAAIDPKSPYVGVDYYKIAMAQFTDQLHPDLPPTTLWGYGQDVSGFKHLGGAIIATEGKPVRVTWDNRLPPIHPLPVDTSLLHPETANLRNHAAPHLHGGLVPWPSDGGPFHWFTGGKKPLVGSSVVPWLPDARGKKTTDYWYPNIQTPRMMWYHDHGVGITRLNAYAGLATGYLLTSAGEQELISRMGVQPGNQIPLVIQDKVFNADGSLWYPDFYDTQFFGPPAPGLPLPTPSLVPEFWGDTMLVNGTAYPTLTVYPRKYRFQILNACNTRFMNLQLFMALGTTFPASTEINRDLPGPVMLQIGNECGFLDGAVNPKGVPIASLNNGKGILLGPAERADVTIDFTALPPGSTIILHNDAPVPFPGGTPLADFYPGNPMLPVPPLPGYSPNTRTLLQFVVGDPIGVPADPSEDDDWTLPVLTQPAATVPGTRDLGLYETIDQYGRLAQNLGTLAGPLNYFTDTPTENLQAGSVEIWRLFNVSADTHPIHFHYFNCRILSRQRFNAGSLAIVGSPKPADANEQGWKETVRANPGEVVTLLVENPPTAQLAPVPIPESPRLAAMGIPGAHEYVWHCHILEHEEHDMMRPLVVTP